MLNRKYYTIRYFLLIIGIALFPNNSVVRDKKEEKSSTRIITAIHYKHSDILFLKNNFTAFKEALAFKESQGKYTAINTLGYLGKYQFGLTTLERFQIRNAQVFLKNPELQEKAFLALCSVNKWILRKDIRRKVGTTINGIAITESGILAAAHLSGAGNVKKYLRSNGKYNLSDAYGSSIEHYMQKFAGYDLSEITANRTASI